MDGSRSGLRVEGRLDAALDALYEVPVLHLPRNGTAEIKI